MQSGKKNKKIIVLCPHPEGYVPAQRLKFEQYYQNWKDEGYELTISSFMSPAMQEIVYKNGFLAKKVWYTILGYLKRITILFSIPKYDIVYLFLWGTPFGSAFYERLLRILSKKLIYDIDDLIFLNTASVANKMISKLKSPTKAYYLFKHADHVLVSTDKLLDYAKRFNQERITLIPATINTEKYKPASTINLNKVSIGWSGSHTTGKYLYLLEKVFLHLSQKYDISIIVMGDPTFRIPFLDNIELLQWSAEKELEYLQRIDIGLHPLPDEEWVYGKSGGKLVQYMAIGIPVVATAIGPNFKAIKEGYNGFLVNSENEWVEKLSLLISNKSLREQMGKNAREVAENVYSIKANQSKYLSVFKELLG